jgi:hypothetical protein
VLEVAKTGKLTHDNRKLVEVWSWVEQLVDEDGYTPLALAVQHGHVHIAVMLLANGARVDSRVWIPIFSFQFSNFLSSPTI